MFSKDSLYVSAIRSSNQLKMDYKQFANGNVVKFEQASFLSTNNSISQDAVFKLNILEQEEPKTYISTLCDTPEQRIIPKNSHIGANEIAVSLNSDFSIAIDKSLLFETKYFFEPCGIDFIYSPFHILNLHCEQNPSGNTLNALILNNHFYFLILDENNNIVHSQVNELTTFEEIKETNFYEDDVLGQKLFDEIYFFELKNMIHTILKEFYLSKKNAFVSKITILHMLKQLSDENIKELHEELLLEFNYHSISIDDFILELAKQPLKEQKSFIKPRKKKKSRFLFFTLLILSLLVTLSGFYLYDYMLLQKERTQKAIIEQKELTKIEKAKPKLPNHKLFNIQIQKGIESLFQTIPDSAVLNELIMDNSNSALRISLIQKDVYIKEIEPKLSKLFKESSISYDEQKPKEPLKATIVNKDSLQLANEKVNQNNMVHYKTSSFLPKLQVEIYLKKLLNTNSTFVFKSSQHKNSFTTFTYEILTTIKEPKELFAMFENINKSSHSIVLSHPISMKKLTKQKIQVSFQLQFNQIQ